MSGLGSPKYDKKIGSVSDDKLAELELRIAKIEKMMGWFKWALLLIGFLYLTNNKNNNEN